MSGLDTSGEWFALVGAIFLLWLLVVSLFAPHIPYTVSKRLDCASKQFIYSLHNATLSAVRHDSRFEVLTNASEFYPAMLEAIAGAEQTINMECYIFRPDKTGRKFMAAMMQRARAGVRVTLVVDAIGAFVRASAIREMRRAGCRVELYQRLRWYGLSRLNTLSSLCSLSDLKQSDVHMQSEKLRIYIKIHSIYADKCKW